MRVVSIRISNLSLGYTPTEDGGPKYPNALSASGTGEDRRVGVLESFLFLWSNERNEFVLLKHDTRKTNRLETRMRRAPDSRLLSRERRIQCL